MRNVGLRIGRSVQPIPSVQLSMITSAPQAIGLFAKMKVMVAAMECMAMERRVVENLGRRDFLWILLVLLVQLVLLVMVPLVLLVMVPQVLLELLVPQVLLELLVLLVLLVPQVLLELLVLVPLVLVV